jgi:hypothetical protein
MTSPGGQATPPAGWYQDPSGQPQMRWWDGTAWGSQTQPGQGSDQAPAQFQAPTPYPNWSPAPGYGQPLGFSQQRPGNGLSIAGIVCGAIAFLFLPIILGPAGLILGGIAKSRGEPKANIALVVSGLGLVGGLIIGFIFASAFLSN